MEPGYFLWCPMPRSEEVGTNVFTVCVTKHWHSLPGEVVVSTLRDIQKLPGQLTLGGSAQARRLGQMTSGCLFPSQAFCDPVNKGTILWTKKHWCDATTGAPHKSESGIGLSFLTVLKRMFAYGNGMFVPLKCWIDNPEAKQTDTSH